MLLAHYATSLKLQQQSVILSPKVHSSWIVGAQPSEGAGSHAIT